jgi:hypothetical protein
MNPNEYINKLIKIIQSCKTLDHLIASEKCVDLFDTREDLHYSFFYKNEGVFPNTHHMGDYDHQIAMYLLRKELRTKSENLSTEFVEKTIEAILQEADELAIQDQVIKLANQMREINIHFDKLDSFKFAIKYLKEDINKI